MAGEYTSAEVLKGTRAFLERYGRVEPLPPPVRTPKVIPIAAMAGSSGSATATPSGAGTAAPGVASSGVDGAPEPTAAPSQRPHSRRSPTSCTAGRRASAPAARSGRSSAR